MNVVPPHSLEAERALIGALLLNNDAFDDVGELRKTDFYDRQLGEIFSSISAMICSGKVADVVSVFEYMRERGGDVDLSELNSLAAGAMSPASAGRMATIIRERATRRGLMSYSSSLYERVQTAIPTDELVEEASSGLYRVLDQRTSSAPESAGDVASAQIAEIDRRQRARAEGKSLAITTGLVDLDRIMSGGIRPGELIIVAGRPAMGKTALATCAAVSQALAGKSVLICSQEMRNEENMDRILSLISGVPIESIRTGNLHDSDWTRLVDASEKLAGMSMYLDDQAGVTLQGVRAKARSIKTRKGLDVVVVDYLQLMSGDGENRTQEVSSLSRGLKLLAVELGVAVVALSQLNRGVELRADRRPTMADLRESGSIEADADAVLLLYRDEVYNPQTLDKGVAEVIVSKQRNGPTGVVHVGFDGARGKFFNLAYYERKQEQQPGFARRRAA